MSEISQSPHRVDLRQVRAASGRVFRGAVTATKTTARIAWAVLKSLGQLAGFLLIAAGGVAAIWYGGQTLLSDDGTLLRHIAESPANPCGGRGTVDSERSQALFQFGLGMFLAIGGGAGIVWWCGETLDSLLHRKAAAAK